MLAYVQGVRYYNDAFLTGQNRDEVIGILAQATGASPQVLSASVPVGLNPDGYVNAQGLADDVQTLRELGYIEQPFDISTIIDNSYVDAAVDQLGAYR
jgi:NitT/TauT family transport system substrate-binding protein